MFKIASNIQVNCSQFLTLKRQYRTYVMPLSDSIKNIADALRPAYERVIVISDTQVDDIAAMPNFWCEHDDRQGQLSAQ